jgi:hypothetical protein
MNEYIVKNQCIKLSLGPLDVRVASPQLNANLAAGSRINCNFMSPDEEKSTYCRCKSLVFSLSSRYCPADCIYGTLIQYQELFHRPERLRGRKPAPFPEPRQQLAGLLKACFCATARSWAGCCKGSGGSSKSSSR